MRIQQQSTNFKAIKITGIESNSSQYWQMYRATSKHNLNARYGKTRWGFYHRYIETEPNSKVENSLLADLKAIFGADKKIKIQTCENAEAQKNRDRLYKH